MSEALMKRLKALEERMNSSKYPSGTVPPRKLRVVVVYGCLPPGTPQFASAGLL
jgi:hypothetical protein